MESNQRTVSSRASKDLPVPLAEVTPVASVSASSSSTTAPRADATSSATATYQDIDSEELEALEDAADDEDESDSEIDRLLDEAAFYFPPEKVAGMIKELKQDGMVEFLHRFVVPDLDKIKHLLIALGVFLPRAIRDGDAPVEILLPILKTALSRILRRREKLPEHNTVEDALTLLRKSRRVVVLSGAGISVSCGIPDFRSKDGIYAQLQREGKYDLDDPQDMFDKSYFLANPSMFYSFAHSIFPSNFVPSRSHMFIKCLENQGKLLRNYSQNIDTLEQIAGIQNVIQCHGSFAGATCTDPTCAYKCKGSEIKDDIFAKRVPECPRCRERKQQETLQAKPKKKRRKMGNGKSWRPGANDTDSDDDNGDASQLAGLGILKPDITFFGEKLDDAFDHAVFADRTEVDLLIIMGTSLKVAPVSELITHIPHSTPVILINKTPVYHIATDIMLLGDSDMVVDYLCTKLAWDLPEVRPSEDVVGKKEVEQVAEAAQIQLDSKDDAEHAAGQDSNGQKCPEPERLLNSHAWLFEGAEPGRLPQLLAEIEEEQNGAGSADNDNDNDNDSDSDDTDDEDAPEANRESKIAAPGVPAEVVLPVAAASTSTNGTM
ncbi:SIR2-domain-containing protein [Testicularia cyperi]|uniref:SIR2-domain-containing protein n=1 Tax=Testicularia cyperi TaxID=1882483 RepID=A0A317XSZ9_9BASI|nr:SIR2-domain-containing protein [Testicularia cyperi]